MIYHFSHIALDIEAKDEAAAKARCEEICDSLQSLSSDINSVWYELDECTAVQE